MGAKIAKFGYCLTLPTYDLKSFPYQSAEVPVFEVGQLIISSLLDDGTGLNDGNPVGVLNGAQPVGNGDDAAIAHHPVQGHFDLILTGRVQCTLKKKNSK